MKLLRWDNEDLIYEGDFSTVRELVEDAIHNKVSLSYANFSFYNFSYIDFSDLDLNHVSFYACSLNYSNFRHADLAYANFTNANVYYSNFNYANLYKAVLGRRVLLGASILNAKLLNTKIILPDDSNALINDAMNWNDLYSYSVSICKTTDNKIFLRMGCKYLSLEDWIRNFWNNDDEFPNNGSPESEMRLSAFKFAVNYAKINGWIKEEAGL